MLTSKILDKYDPRGLYKIYDAWPEISSFTYENTTNHVDFKNIDHIVFAGMGGSGTIGELMSSILSKSNLHTCVVKGYLLPKTVDKNTLVVTTSISGFTVETLTILEKASKLKCKIIAFSSDGKMQDYCIKNNVMHQRIEQIHSPRASLPTAVYSLLAVLSTVLKIKESDVKESIRMLYKTGEKINSNNLSTSNPALSIASWIDQIPIIYYPYGLHAAAIRFKNSLQENSKIHAMTEDVIEMCHNGIVSWEKPSKVQPILIRGTDDYIKTKERWQILKRYFKLHDIDFREILSVQGSILSKLINLIYTLDYTSIYHAVTNETDPSPVSSIDYIKSKL